MNAFEKSIKEQLITYREKISEAREQGNRDFVSMYQAELRGFLKGLETCLNKNYVSTFVDYINACY